MAPPEDHCNTSPPASINTVSDLVSPGGKSRYGRTRRPKISSDFYNIDDVIIDETPAKRHSPVKSPKSKPLPKLPIDDQDLIYNIKEEFTQLDDLGMKVANNFKSNLQRGLDDSIKERKFFKSSFTNNVDVSSVDVNKVIKLITKPPVVSEVCEGRTSSKTLKTYSNKRKWRSSDEHVVESFGLPDEPIVPIKKTLPIERDKKIDIDINCKNDVNLSGSWKVDELESISLCSESVNNDVDINFNEGVVSELFPNDRLNEKNINITLNCRNKKNGKTQNICKSKDANTKRRSSRSSHENVEDSIVKNIQEKPKKKLIKNPFASPKKKKTFEGSTRVLRRSANGVFKANLMLMASECCVNQNEAENQSSVEIKVEKEENIEEGNESNCSVTVIETLEDENPVIKNELEIDSNEVETVKEKTKGSRKKYCDPQKSVEIKDENALENIEFRIGDLAWAKLGSHSYWPCLITEEPSLGIYKQHLPNRILPDYHVRFFGDNGRRAWVISRNIMLFHGPDDLQKLAEVLSTKIIKKSYIKESCTVKPAKLSKWQEGVDEALSLKSKSIEERLEFFITAKFEVKRKKWQNLEVKKEQSDESSPKDKRRISYNGDENVKKFKKDPEEVVIEDVVKKDDTNDEKPDSKQKKIFKTEEFTEESVEARKKLRSQNKFSIDSNEMKPKRSSIDEVEEKDSKIRKRQHVSGEFSNSDTDSKISDNSVPTSLESQAALHRRNNIFRGIPKDRVCQLCEEGGDILKCKGPCNGVYHYKCAMQLEMEESEEKNESETKDDNQGAVEIVQSPSLKTFPDLLPSSDLKDMSLSEKIDFRMKEIMKKSELHCASSDSIDSSSEELVMDDSEKQKNQPKLSLTVTNKPSKKEVPIIKHVTADNVSYVCVTEKEDKETNKEQKDSLEQFKCIWCKTNQIACCFVCNKEESKTGSKYRKKCSLHQCGKFYHPECLKLWPQTQWCLIQSVKDKKSEDKYDTFVCPRHVCHTCISDDPRASNSRCGSDKVAKCLRCPATYHSSNYCVPAGTHILSAYQIVCPRHFTNSKSRKKMPQTINTNWCFICSKGGNLICCETCPTSVHIECLPGDFDADDTFFCEDCQSGRLPLYDEIVWVKLGTFRWWPALILFPNEVPERVRNIDHNKGDFVVKFFGTYDHYWVGRGRTFLFQEGDKGYSNSAKNRVDNAFLKAIKEAAAAHELKKQFKLNKVAEKTSGLKPPHYIRIKVNKPVGNVRLFDGNTSNTQSCNCDPTQPHPCGPDSNCLNRLLMTECNPEVCPAGERCNNQCFEKREYPPLVPYRTHGRGWGLKTLAPIRKGQFVIEYVGEIIDEQEYQRRIKKMHEQKEENYYFLTIDKDRTLDAGPKGNVARFMNHSCQPNCETQKWTVNGDTRVGLFATCDIPAETELTFNYNLECIGKEKKICKCGAPNCSGFIGVKVKPENPSKKVTRKINSKPKKKKIEIVEIDNPCFVCGNFGEVGACNNKICPKYYHLECVGLQSWPDGGKWICQWHKCNICLKRTIRCCIKCLNSYCPSHSEGNVRYDKQLGFVCSEHDLEKKMIDGATKVSLDSSDKTKSDSVVAKIDDKSKKLKVNAELIDVSKRLNGFITSTPLKESNESSLNETTISDVSSTVEKVVIKKTKKGKKITKNTAISKNVVKLQKLNTTDPDKDLPIRKRTRLRCGNTL